MTADDKYDGAMRSYKPDIEKLPADFQHLLETYSKIPADRTVAHVNAVRKRAFEVCPYPCIGQWKFLALTFLKHPKYQTILSRLKSGQTFLDVGCCFAQDMRQMIADGVPSDHLYGIEIEKELVDIGYDLFDDSKTNKAKFMIGDALNPGTSFDTLKNSIDIINDSAFSHLWPWHEQRKVCTMMAGFSKPGAMIVGRMTGSLKPAEYPAMVKGTTGWRHNVESLQRLWDEVGEATGMKWKAHGTMDLEGIFPVPDDLLCGTSNVAPLGSNAGSFTSNHSAENHRDRPREIVADVLAPSSSSPECSSNVQECRRRGLGKEFSTGAADQIAIAVTESSKTTSPECLTPQSSSYRPRPVKDIAAYKSFPPASRHRALHQEAMKFAANARNIFVHYVEPILDFRRKEKLASGTTKKKFYYNAARLWAELQTIDELHGQRFFWNQKAVEMKLALKKKMISPEDLLRNAGFEEDWWENRKYAEIAVGWYLGEDVPQEFADGTREATTADTADDQKMESLRLEEKLHSVPGDICKPSFHHDLPEFAQSPAKDEHPLLNVLPEPFQYDSKIMYGQFAHADYTEIRRLLDGKQQTARLRQLADLFDATGKVLFYYYAYPHIWKDFRPLKIDETVATRAQDKWKVLGSKEQEFWRVKSAQVKKMLGDGNVDGLICLELDRLDSEVLGLHRVMGYVLKEP
ncbi:hypothetical protein AC578_8084 [Pseudocercospora eumusae]|uniref:Methyltransferase domain-containing protein n=1 Tax=Pseudocercospora eumusae TaxID=321146 RepID=A0A139H0P3_9PEZI|nr:hypothetical protein AC578_8084 [Pseudocercospora eumusae]